MVKHSYEIIDYDIMKSAKALMWVVTHPEDTEHGKWLA